MSAPAVEFYYIDNANQRQGPMSELDVARLVNDGVIQAETRVWTAGMQDWREAASVDQLARLFERTMVMPSPRPSQPSGPPAGAPSYPPSGMPAGASMTPAQPMGAPMSPSAQPGQAGARPAPSPSGYVSAFAAADSMGARPAQSFGQPSAVAMPGGWTPGPLQPAMPIWGLLGRALLAALGSMLIVPSPWTTTMMYQFLCEHTALPGGAKLKFVGQPLDIWYIFIGIGVAGWLRLIPYGGGLVGMLITWFLLVLVLRWFCSKVELETGSLNLTFHGDFLQFIGWNLLLIVSFITIIGWAWVMRLMFRWICQNVRGACGFEFQGAAVELLWRTLVVGLGAIFIIPIPWLMQWYTNWIISQIHVVPATA